MPAPLLPEPPAHCELRPSPRSLNHPHIVNVSEVVVGPSLDAVFMVMEYCDHDLKAGRCRAAAATALCTALVNGGGSDLKEYGGHDLLGSWRDSTLCCPRSGGQAEFDGLASASLVPPASRW